MKRITRTATTVIAIALLASVTLAMPTELAQAGEPPYKAKQVVSSYNTHCVLTTEGEVLCWPVDNLAPQKINGLSNVTQISAGRSHICALQSDGHMLCWGQNTNGQLGIGVHDLASPTPVTPIGMVDGVELIWAGGIGTCAVRHGGLKCWGGVFINDDEYSPVILLKEGTGIKAFGEGCLCVILNNGGLMCWGSGPLGDGTNDDSQTPVYVLGFVVTNAYMPVLMR
jgi:hypothetical protein